MGHLHGTGVLFAEYNGCYGSQQREFRFQCIWKTKSDLEKRLVRDFLYDVSCTRNQIV
jgi:hypothetical protein